MKLWNEGIIVVMTVTGRGLHYSSVLEVIVWSCVDGDMIHCVMYTCGMCRENQEGRFDLRIC